LEHFSWFLGRLGAYKGNFVLFARRTEVQVGYGWLRQQSVSVKWRFLLHAFVKGFGLLTPGSWGELSAYQF
jgi:hypothetical protein